MAVISWRPADIRALELVLLLYKLSVNILDLYDNRPAGGIVVLTSFFA